MEPIEITNISDFKRAKKYVVGILQKRQVTKPVIAENMLIFEALFHEILSLKKDEDTVVTILGEERLGCVSIRFTFEGGMYAPGSGEVNLESPEEKILQAFSDKIDYSYQFGFTRIRITMRNSPMKAMLPCGVAVIAGILMFFLLSRFGIEEMKESLLSNIIFPLETLFGNAMLMVGAPVTFLSLL